MKEHDAATTDGWGWLLLFLAVGGAINGIWMLVDPAHWYHHLPAGPETAHGPPLGYP